MHVAGDRRFRRVVVGVGIDPQHEQRSALPLPVTRDTVDRSHRQRMIATEEDRNRAGLRQHVAACAERADPALDLVVIFGIRGRRFLRRCDAGRSHVAMVLHAKSELLEDTADARGPQRCRPHQGAGLRGADLEGDAEQGDAGVAWGFGHQMARSDIVGDIVGSGKGALAPCPPSFISCLEWWAR